MWVQLDASSSMSRVEKGHKLLTAAVIYVSGAANILQIACFCPSVCSMLALSVACKLRKMCEHLHLVRSKVPNHCIPTLKASLPDATQLFEEMCRTHDEGSHMMQRAS